MLRSFFASRQWALWAWGGMLLLFVLVVVEVRVLVWLNEWYRETWDFLQTPHPAIIAAIQQANADWQLPVSFYDDTSEDNRPLIELAKENIARFWSLLLEFCVIVFPFIFLRVFTGFFAQHYAFRWRQAMTFAYFPLWAKTEHDIEGASQRMQQDPERFSRIVENLGLGAFRAVLTLIAFIPILWGVSVEIRERYDAAEGLQTLPIELPFFEWTALTPGSLMWVALVMAVGGTLLSFLVGAKLPGLEYNNQKVEARFRKWLVYGEDDKKFADSETLVGLFTGLRFNYFRLYLHYSYFGLWSTTFSQMVIIADLVLIGAGVVLGVITLGFLNQISHAFSKVTESLSYFVNSWTTVTELLSVIKRLREFERNIGYAGTPLPQDHDLSVQKIQ